MIHPRSARFPTLALIGIGAVTTLLSGVGPSRAADPASYWVDAPAYPVVYTEAQKEAQRVAGRAIIGRVRTAIAAGAREFMIPPGTYRLPAEGPDNIFKFEKVKNFALRVAGTAIILDNGGGLVDAIDSENMSVIGPARIESGVIPCTQGRLIAYDSVTGVADVQILPGYELTGAAKGTVDAFSPQGVYLENSSWAGFQNMVVVDAAKRRITATLGKRDAIWARIYQPGALLAFRIHGSPVLLSARRVNGCTLQDLNVYTESGIGWGGGTGAWNFLRVKGIRRPGTSRLMGAGGCQMNSYGGSVLFDGCEFSNTADDLIDYGGGGLFMNVRRDSPRELLLWGGSAAVGDRLNFYTHADFRITGSAKVMAVREVQSATEQAEAHDVAKRINKGRDTGESRVLRRVTLDRDVLAKAGDFVENDNANRADRFTICNCFLHDSGVRVMVQGFKHGLFENNRFERISGGLTLTCDAWWWEGPTCQDIIVRNNIFKETAFRNAWGTGKAALVIGAGWAEGKGDVSHGCAFHSALVTGNTFVGSSAGAIFVSNTDHVVIEKNNIQNAYTLAASAGAVQLAGVLDAKVWDNVFSHCPGLNVSVLESQQVSIRRNVFRAAYRSAAKPPRDFPDAALRFSRCANLDIANNEVDGTDAANVFWITDSRETTLANNRAAHLTTPGAVLVGGANNAPLRAVGSDRDRPGLPEESMKP